MRYLLLEFLPFGLVLKVFEQRDVGDARRIRSDFGTDRLVVGSRVFQFDESINQIYRLANADDRGGKMVSREADSKRER